MSKTPDIVKAIFDKKKVEREEEKEEEIEVLGIWECAYCGINIERVIHPYFPNMPDSCVKKCRESSPTPRFFFIKWKILK